MHVEFLTQMLISVIFFSHTLRFLKIGRIALYWVLERLFFCVHGKQEHGYSWVLETWEVSGPLCPQLVPAVCICHSSHDFSIQRTRCCSHNKSTYPRISMCPHPARASQFHLVPIVICRSQQRLHNFAGNAEFPHMSMLRSKERDVQYVSFCKGQSLSHPQHTCSNLFEANDGSAAELSLIILNN